MRFIQQQLFLATALVYLLAFPCTEATVLMLEDFETDGSGDRYIETGSFSDGQDDYFTRTDGFTEASGIPAWTGFDGSYFYAAEDIDSPDNPEGLAWLTFNGIDLADFPAIQISLTIGGGSNSVFDSVDDFVFVQYRVDTGSWQTALAFQNNGQVYNGPLLQDIDFDGIGDINELTLSMQDISSEVLPVSGDLLSLRIDTFMTAGYEAVAFDNIQVVGVPEPNLTAMVFGVLSLLLLLTRKFLPQREIESQA